MYLGWRKGCRLYGRENIAQELVEFMARWKMEIGFNYLNVYKVEYVYR
jgi:hypothetical protein